MNTRSIKYLVLSDIHLGSSRNTTKEIVAALRTYLKDNNKLFKKLNFIFIAGDIFDKLLSPSSDEYILAIEWLTEVAMYCKNNKIKLRILEGTPSHDWRQARVAETTFEKLEIDVDFKYITTLDIEKNVELGINILYLPDEYKAKGEETFEEVKKLLIENNLSKVDIAIMHGQFDYQLPIKLDCSHNEENWLSIVKYYISIGHIHTSSVNGRILAQGSFDRMSMGEEEPKGGMYIQIFHNGTMEFNFIENKEAKIFKTINYEELSLEEILSRIEDDLETIKTDSYVRLIVSDTENLNKILKPIKDKFDRLNIKLETPKKRAIEITDAIEHMENIESFHITKENIVELLNGELTKYELPMAEKRIVKEEIEKVI